MIPLNAPGMPLAAPTATCAINPGRALARPPPLGYLLAFCLICVDNSVDRLHVKITNTRLTLRPNGTQGFLLFPAGQRLL